MTPSDRLRRILDGIDRTETDDPPGWWETSTGAGFGAQKLAEVEQLVDGLTAAMREAIRLIDSSDPSSGKSGAGADEDVVTPDDAVIVLERVLDTG